MARTLDTAAVLAHAPATVRKLASRGNAQYTFTTTRPADEPITRKARKGDHNPEGMTHVLITPEQAAGERLAVLSPDRGTFRAPTVPKPAVAIGAWVRITRAVPHLATEGEVGQVWCEGEQSATVWVAMGGTRWVQVGTESVEVLGASEGTADALWDEPVQVEPADAAADAVALAERAEACGRDGVEFVRTTMGDAAADAVTAHRTAPVVHAEPIGPVADDGARIYRRPNGDTERVTITGPTAPDGWTPCVWEDGGRGGAMAQRLEPVERVIVTTSCTECGETVDALGYDTYGSRGCTRGTAGARHVPACDGPDALPVGSVAILPAPTSTHPDHTVVAHVEAHARVRGIDGTRVRTTHGVTWTPTRALTPAAPAPARLTPDEVCARIHVMRRAHRRLQAWRRACAEVRAMA